MADHRTTDQAVPAPAVRPYRVTTEDTHSDKRTEQSQAETRRTRNERRPPTGIGDMTQDAQRSGEEARSLGMQLGNAFTLAARAAPASPQAPEDRGQKFPDCPDFSGSDRTQLRRWIAQLRMVIRHKSASFPD